MLVKRQNSLGRNGAKSCWEFMYLLGEDCVSAFKGKGKFTSLKKLMKYPKFHSAFSKLGEEWIVPEDVTKYFTEFICLMYGYVRETSVNAVRT